MKVKLTLLLFFQFSICSLLVGQTIVNDYYNIKSGTGKGIKFWSSNNYKIHMGSTTNYRFGPVSSYSIKMNMSNHANRGWVWGVYNKQPVAALNTGGNFQIKGWMKIGDVLKIEGSTDASKTAGSGALEIAGALRLDGNEIITNANKILYLNYDNNGDISMDGTTMRVDASANSVGIGFTAPQSKLEVRGTVRATSTTTRSNRTEIGHSGSHGFVNTVGAGNLDFKHEGATLMRLKANGNLVLGNVSTPSSSYKLYVEKGILSEKVRVAVNTSADWADYVFEDSYSKLPIQEVSNFIEKNKHLPNVPSAEEVVKDGINVAEMDAILLRQIEELWLHVIELKKENELLKNQVFKN